MVQSIESRVAEVFKSHHDRPEELRAFVAELHTELREAYGQMRTNLAFLVILWMSAVLISGGLISELALGGFKIAKLNSVLVALPPLIGWISYRLSTCDTAAALLGRALGEAYRATLPKARELDLQILVAINSFIGVERLLYTRGGAIRVVSQLWVAIIKLLYTVGTAIALAHVSWLASVGASFSFMLFASVSTGVVLWARGLVVIITSLVFYE